MRLKAVGLMIIGKSKAYLILLQSAEFRDQAGERVFSRNSRSIWDEGVFGHEPE
jgi:hypothetical protein